MFIAPEGKKSSTREGVPSRFPLLPAPGNNLAFCLYALWTPLLCPLKTHMVTP